MRAGDGGRGRGARATIVRAESLLPPGESGFVSLAGVPTGTGSPHLYDQQDPFIHFAYKNAALGQTGTTEQPKDGVQVTRDGFGVPSVTGTTTSNLWWGAGYATAQDRLFELEVFRRATTGHLAEKLGKSYVPMDVQVRRDFYTPDEVMAMFDHLPAPFQQRYRDYAEGINAWVDHVNSDPADLPGEFPAVAATPTHFSVADLAAIGIYLARTTPNTDGIELNTMAALQASGARKLDRILPLRTPGQISTVPRSEGLFPSVPGRTRGQERTALARSAAYVRKLPQPKEGDLGTEPDMTAPPSELANLIRPIRRGGSYMVAIGSPRKRRAVFFNGPELGFSAPEELYEIELHGPGLDARGITAPGAPLVAIGHNAHVAFGLTSGLSQTNALYAEKLVPGQPDEYYFHGRVRHMSCRTETFSYSSPPTALLGPSIPESGEQTLKLCRTVHGPVQARAGDVAYARRYATWKGETDTIVGLSAVDTARTIADVNRAMAKVTWNENLMAADDHGHIGYWHPGLLPVRSKAWDERLPYPGTGQAEWRGFLPVSQRPHAIDPAQGWLSNWNNIPSQGWTTGNAPATERVAGRWFRVGFLNRMVHRYALAKISFTGLKHAVRLAGTTAEQQPLAKPLLRRALRGAGGGTAALLRTILAWDGNYDRTDSDGKVDPGAACWQELKNQTQKLAIAPLGKAGQIIGAEAPNDEHLFDVSLGQAYALRTLSTAQLRQAATAAFNALSAKFGNSDPTTWRTPRAMFDQAALGAEQPPPMPFFDRGTFEQFVELRG